MARFNLYVILDNTLSQIFEKHPRGGGLGTYVGPRCRPQAHKTLKDVLVSIFWHGPLCLSGVLSVFFRGELRVGGVGWCRVLSAWLSGAAQFFIQLEITVYLLLDHK